MFTKELLIKYRPVRIGFLVRDGNIEDLVTAAGINTLLFGGIYNPLIPISEDNHFSEQLIRLYNVDVIYDISEEENIKVFSSKYKFDRNPFTVSKDFFYEDWETKKNCISYLDSLNLIYFNYDRYFKGKQKGFSSDFIFPLWDEEHALGNLFSFCFGYYPTCYNLKYDFEHWFNIGLQAFSINLNSKNDEDSSNFEVDAAIIGRTTPIKLTGMELSGHGGTLRDNGVGIFVGNENNFKDLCLFWNLRAAGTQIEFLPINHFKGFEHFINVHLHQADNVISKSTSQIDFISAYCRHENFETVKQVIQDLKSDHRLLAFPCDDEVRWNGYNLTIKNPYFFSKPTLSSIIKNDNQYISTFTLPSIPIINDWRNDTKKQSMVASVEVSLEEATHSKHTLNVPHLRKLNPFYGSKFLSHAMKVKAEDKGLRVIIRPEEHSLSLSLIHYDSLIKSVFDLAGIKADHSQPGIITEQILRKLDGIQGARAFKITGVRKLLNTLNKDQTITRGQATKMIFEENFHEFDSMIIKPRETQRLKPNDVFDFLLEKEFFRAGLDLVCKSCNLVNWLSLREVDDFWFCNYCGEKHQTSLHLSNRGDWKFRKSGLFAKDNNQEGAIPVILTLLQLHRSLASFGYIYTTALNLDLGTRKCETDFCIMTYDSMFNIRVGIGECKSEGGEITLEDVANLKAVAEKFAQLKIETYLIFSKTSNHFTTYEIELFRRLKKDYIPCILFTKKELESDKLIENISEKPIISHPFSLSELSDNSDRIYLKEADV